MFDWEDYLNLIRPLDQDICLSFCFTTVWQYDGKTRQIIIRLNMTRLMLFPYSLAFEYSNEGLLQSTTVRQKKGDVLGFVVTKRFRWRSKHYQVCSFEVAIVTFFYRKLYLSVWCKKIFLSKNPVKTNSYCINLPDGWSMIEI